MKYFCLNKERNGSCYLSREIGMNDMNFKIIKKYDPYSAMRYRITMEQETTKQLALVRNQLDMDEKIQQRIRKYENSGF